ncbi:DUF4148 domain-containing protein [Paraburkholderia sp. Ac-20342]|uniref:DUF4148 domain-containing protein n=1 Tax=Paraburkholderia sp. Ac-20342 TaxID=2703889 RepID=UPI00197E6975|nr:DUF4148 domain-containing protein [Paraburkholderia sp. Ac-20342]MBN3851485.1 DUF4148 domain-containing protein [Paraburkholderia sp. Ac-20342]
MKKLSRIECGVLLAAACIGTVCAPAVAQADPAAPPTRAQVRADLAEWRAAGYEPLDWLGYPVSAQRAGRIVAERRAQQHSEAATVH